MKNWGFDGIDVDWEYPKNEAEAASFSLLLKAVRDELDSYAAKHAPGHHFILSIAAPAGPQHYGKLDFPALARTLDHIDLMGYDYAGSFTSVTGHASNLYKNTHLAGSTPFNTHDAVQAYLQGGIPPQKLVLGMPGLGNWEAGAWDYKVLPKQGGNLFYDDITQASYSYYLYIVSRQTPARPPLDTSKTAALNDKSLGQRAISLYQVRGLLGPSLNARASGRD
ncbi:hypothetical protein FDECE_2886 [Fusarium decemcellulare]|nr:hypothetical protein FDECE_2886 [Fusarium decemcellulare]